MKIRRVAKWAALFLIVAAAIVMAHTLLFQPDPSVKHDIFETQLDEVFARDGYTVLAHAPCSPDELPLPFATRWHPRRWLGGGSDRLTFGFPDGAGIYTVTRNGSGELDCYVRYLDGRARVIDVRAQPAQHSEAKTLPSALARQFPGLPVRLTSKDSSRNGNRPRWYQLSDKLRVTSNPCRFAHFTQG